MTSRGALRERMALLGELRQIVQAMRNLAFAQLQRCSRSLAALRPARAELLRALRGVPAPAGAGAPSRPAPPIWLLVGSERGFCGAFNTRLAEAAEALVRAEPGLRLLVAGRVLRELLEGREVGTFVVLEGCAGLEDLETCLDTWLDHLAPLLDARAALWVLHADHDGLARRRLWPDPAHAAGVASALDAASGHASALDTASGVASASDAASGVASASDAASDGVDGPEAPGPEGPGPGPAPRLQLSAAALRPALEAQALRLQLQAALVESLEQENHWRLNQMQRAQDHLDELGEQLRRRHAALRQSEITNELETLISSLDGAGAPGPSGPAGTPPR